MNDRQDLRRAVRLLCRLDAVIVALRTSGAFTVAQVEFPSSRRALGIGNTVADAIENAVANGIAVAA